MHAEYISPTASAIALPVLIFCVVKRFRRGQQHNINGNSIMAIDNPSCSGMMEQQQYDGSDHNTRSLENTHNDSCT